MENEEPDKIMVKMEVVQAKVDDNTNVMQENIQSMAERGESLDDLEKKQEVLTEQALAFQKNTKVVEKKLWWKNIQATITFAMVVLLVIVAIILYFVFTNKSTPKP